KLANADIKVTLGIPGLKVHSKLCVVTREGPQGNKRYGVIGTGNFNENTARVYTDFALFTANQAICAEAESVFQFIEASYRHPPLKHLRVSPLNTRREIERRIEREIDHARAGGQAISKAKLNNMVVVRRTHLLYRASQAGVRIRLIVRGMSGIRPPLPGISDNIHIPCIVDRFLEHTRMVIFAYMGD